MSTAYVIEIDEMAAGIVAAEGKGFRFYAAIRAFAGLEGAFFTTPKQAEIAARAHLKKRGKSAKEGASVVR